MRLRRPRLATPAIALALALAPAACGPAVPPPPKEESVPLDKIPPEVMKVAQDRLKGIEFEQAWKLKDDSGGDAYEIRGRDENGKTREVKVSAAGKILEEE